MKKDKFKIFIIAAVAVILVIFAVVCIKKVLITSRQNEEIANLKQSITQMDEENSALEETIADAEDESNMEQIARDNGYVYPEERIYYDSDVS